MQPDSIAGRYRVVRAVGKGGMGTVWLCTDETLHRQVAVKQVGTVPGESPGDTARAMREARLAAALNHKNAVSIYDVVEHAGSTWLVMEYVPSRTLSELIASEGRLATERVAHIGAQVAAALSSAHALGIVHRDIKPGNILVSDDDTAKISDFGIARGHQDLQLTQTGLVSGTPAFFSPELARGEDPTFASDVWALGITLYTATEGSPPYETQSNPLAMLSAITREPIPPPTHAGVLTGPLAGMLHPDASERSTMSEALAALRAAQAPSGTEGDASWEATALMGSPAAAAVAYDATSTFQQPEEPTADRHQPAPALASTWSADGGDSPPPDDSDERGGRGRLAMALLALLVLVGAGALLWNVVDLGGDGGEDPTSANSSTTGGPNANPGQGNQNTPPPEEESSTNEETTSTTDEQTTSTTEEPPAGDPVAFAESYFAVVPGDTDAGWNQLTPSFQAETGRESYDDFWGPIESVALSNVESLDDETVQYQIVYQYEDGTESGQETKQLTLEPAGDSYLIAGDAAAG